MSDDSHYYQGKSFTNVISKHPVRMLLQTTTHKIEGDVYVRHDEREKDALNTNEPFIAVTDAQIFAQNGTVEHDAGFMAIHRDHIIWAIPLREDQPDEERANE